MVNMTCSLKRARKRLQRTTHDLDYGKYRDQKRQQRQGARFCEEAGEGKGQERDGKCHNAAQRVERAKRKECLNIPHANARGVANTTPERLGKHKDKVDDDRKTGVVKRRVNALVESNARKRRHGTRAGKLIGKASLTGINRRAGKDANPKRNIDHRTPPWAAAQTQKPPQRCLSPLWWFKSWLFGALHDLVKGNAYGVLRRHPVDL